MDTKTVFEIRSENLGKLVDAHNGTRSLERRIGMAASLISRITCWHPNDPNPNHKRMGEKMARNIETILGLPSFWMDISHDEHSSLQLTKEAKTESPRGLSSIQIATCDKLVNLMVAGKITDADCLNLLKSWKVLISDLDNF